MGRKRQRNEDADIQKPKRKELHKFWTRRYSLFSKFDEGIQMTDQQWYSVTPEKVAIETVDYILEIFPNTTVVIDPCGGAGGNTIQFALNEQITKVVYCDIDEETTRCAMNNAQVYNCQDAIEFHACNIFDLHKNVDLTQLDTKNTVLFLSPPWGGPKYMYQKTWRLDSQDSSSKDRKIPITHILSYAKHHRLFKVCLFLPRNTDLNDLANLPGEGTIFVRYLFCFGTCIGMCVCLDVSKLTFKK